MDASDASDPNETQATQMLQELLDHKPYSSVKHNNQNTVLKSQAVQFNEISSDSIPSSRGNNSAPHYHLHGLASTQSQSNNQTEEEIDTGSQKENIGATKTSKDPTISNSSRSHSPHVAPSKSLPSKGKNAAQTTMGNAKGTNKKSTITVPFDSTSNPDQSNSLAGKASSRQKTHKSTTKFPPSRYKVPPRPVSPASSIDSFARDPDENIEEAFVARVQQFDIPLSELGRATPPKEMPLRYYSSEEDSRSPPKILVPDSQEESPEVTNLSQQFNDSTQIDGEAEQTSMNEPPPAQLHDRGYESSASDSTSPYGSYPKDGADALIPVAEGESTQPSTQPEEPADVGHPFDTGPSLWSNLQSSRPATSTSVPQSNPRSLLSMVRPEIQHRYKNYAQPNSFSPQPQQRQPLPPSVLGTEENETQPSVVPVNRSRPAPARRPAQTNQLSGPSIPPTGKHVNTVKPSRLPSSGYPMDVVPDSEPARLEERALDVRTSTSKHNSATFITKARNRNDLTNTNEDVGMSGPDEEPRVIVEEEEEEEEDDDDDDIPLAASSRRAQPVRPAVDKGKRKAVDEPAGPTAGRSTAIKAAAATKGNKNSNVQKKRKLNGSWETGIVPSSVPEENISVTQRVTRANNVVGREKKTPATKATKRKPNSRQSTRSTSSKPKSNAKQADAEESDEEILSKVDDMDEGNDNGTDMADDVEDDKKRKPVATPKRLPLRGKESEALKRAKREEGPVARQASRSLRSGASISEPKLSPTRVFALWKSDGHYYSGTVHSRDPDDENRFTVHFDDNMTETVFADEMRRGELLAGDNVLFGKRSRPVKVISVENVPGGSVMVDCKSESKILLKHIRIAHKDIVSSWRDRVLDSKKIVTSKVPDVKNLSHSPSKSSIRGGEGILSGTCVLSTVRASGPGWIEEKNRLEAITKQVGARSMDVSQVIRLEGKYSANSNRYILEHDDIEWIGGNDIDRLFLVADACNLKPKFLIALALGIPCLSSAWLYDCARNNEEMKWTQYLLPAGWSETMSGHPSQHINFNWGRHFSELQQIKSNPFPAKIFAGKHFLCVGDGMFPDGTKGVDQKTMPQVVLAMGAKIVECVKTLTYASLELAQYDYILIKDQRQYLHDFTATTTVDWAWVKESLICSRLAPFPDWAVEQSQET